jgi:hypothetical protein
MYYLCRYLHWIAINVELQDSIHYDFKMKIRAMLPLAFLSFATSVVLPIPANASVTWSATSRLDVAYDGKLYNSQYDLEYVSSYIFDNEQDGIYFYFEFLQTPRVSMFNDGLDSFGFIGLDYDKDGENDFEIWTPRGVDLRSDRTYVNGRGYSVRDGSSSLSSCAVNAFTNIDEGARWVGFRISRLCIGLPNTFNMYGYVEYNDKANVGSWDYAPYPSFAVTLPNSSNSGNSGTTATYSGATYSLPLTRANESTLSSNFSEPPSDLSKLSETLLPSVVTVECGDGSGTGWSADSTLSDALRVAGFKSIVVTNFHVIEDCLTTKSVSLVLSNGSSISGTVVSWNASSDVAGIATKTSIPAMQWIGSRPKQGWWVGVLGSPLGEAGVLTTGIVSSVNAISNTFTFTAAINPGNSGGPVFDSTGRVLGLATSKNLISSNVLAEGFGNAQGTPLLCSKVISCDVEKDPWGATSKFKSSASAQELAAAAEAKIAQDKAVSEARAAAEAAAKIAQDKAVSEARAAAEAAAKIAQDKAVSEARAAAEAAAKIAQDKAVSEARAAAEAAAKIAIEKAATEAKTSAEIAARNAAEALTKSQTDFASLSANFNTTLNKYNELVTQNEFLQGIVKTLQAQINELLKPKVETIVCTKGSAYKIVKKLNPECPKGFKKK